MFYHIWLKQTPVHFKTAELSVLSQQGLTPGSQEAVHFRGHATLSTWVTSSRGCVTAYLEGFRNQGEAGLPRVGQRRSESSHLRGPTKRQGRSSACAPWGWGRSGQDAPFPGEHSARAGTSSCTSYPGPRTKWKSAGLKEKMARNVCEDLQNNGWRHGAPSFKKATGGSSWWSSG